MPLQLQALNGSYATVRRFLPALLNGITFEGSPRRSLCRMPGTFYNFAYPTRSTNSLSAS